MWDLQTLIIYSGLTFFVSIVSSVLGFGGLLLLIAGSSLFLDIKYSIALGAVYSLSSAVTRTVIFRQYIDKKLIKLLMLGILPGGIFGLFLYNIAESNILGIILGVFIIGYVINKIVNSESSFQPKKWAITLISFIYASASSLIGATSPIIVILMQQLKKDKNEFIAMMSIVYLTMGVIKFVGYLYIGALSLDNIPVLVAIVLCSILGSIIGKRIVPFVSQKLMENFVLVLLLAYGVRAILGGILG